MAYRKILSQPRPTPPLEDEMTWTITAGQSLADHWRAVGPDLPGRAERRLTETLARLDVGQSFDERDEPMLDEMSNALRRALNALRDGYGERAFADRTEELCILFPEDRQREKLRNLTEDYKAYRGLRRRALNRIAAERELRRLL